VPEPNGTMRYVEGMEMVLQRAGGAAEQVRPARISVERYHRMIEQDILTPDDRIELLDGYLVEKMSKKPAHCIVTAIVYSLLMRRMPGGWSVRSQDPITLADSEPEPDLAVVRGQVRDYQSRHPLASDIGLVVEVADSSVDRDRIWKREIYARAGLPVYWLINLQEKTVEVYSRPVEGNYLDHRIVGPTETLTLQDPALEMAAGEIWE
jgi:Uma2 family endonuclease